MHNRMFTEKNDLSWSTHEPFIVFHLFFPFGAGFAQSKFFSSPVDYGWDADKVIGSQRYGISIQKSVSEIV
jgi:hypothetical protein